MNIVIEQIKAFFGNYLLVSAMIAWFSAQIIKIFTGLYQHGKITLRKLLFSTGGMPSSHSASVLALTVASGIQHGLGSSYFAICAILSIIVMIEVRLRVGGR